jgi:hypothetical protein
MEHIFSMKNKEKLYQTNGFETAHRRSAYLTAVRENIELFICRKF